MIRILEKIEGGTILIKLLLTIGFVGLVLFVLLQIEEHDNILKDSENDK